MGSIKNVLVTGASGFLGSHLITGLINKGYKPIAYLRENSNIWRLKHLKNKYVSFIDNDQSDLKSLFEQNQIDAILHTATEYGKNSTKANIIETNVVFPIRLIETGLDYGLKAFVNTDSFFAKRHYKLQYLNDYTKTKRILSDFLESFSDKLSIHNLILEHLYGENDSEQKFVTSIVKQVIQNKGEISLTEGLQKRDFIYVDDVVNAYLKIIEQNMYNGYFVYEVGTGYSITVKEFVQKLGLIIKTTSTFNFGAISTREGEIMESVANTTALQNIGWQPIYNIESALKKMIIKEKKRFKYEH